MKTNERNIPVDIERHLRQEAGFGCCICGHPIYEYHHIAEFSKSHTHVSGDMMLLCPNHHHEATVHAISEQDQRNWKQNPYNIQRGYIDGLLKIDERAIGVEVGGNQLIGKGFKFVVDDESLLTIGQDSDERMLLNVSLVDKDDVLLLQIRDNKWILGDPNIWDFGFSYRWLKLWQKQRDIVLELDARKTPMLIKGKFWRKSQSFTIDSEEIRINSVVGNIGFRHLTFVGMFFSVNTKMSSLEIAPDPSFGQGCMISNADPVERYNQGLKAYDEIVNKKKDA
jgi:hypothetical protein